MKPVRFIDLFAGIGGLRLGFEQGFESQGIPTQCVMTSEIKPHALKVLHRNFGHDHFVGDITRVPNNEIPDFDFLLGGFPCQPFSAGGKRQGFVDTRGTLFFEIERIIAEKRPYGFILENVEGLVRHDLENPKDRVGRTLRTILERLSEMGYSVNWNVLDAQDFNLPQTRKRVFIVGTLTEKINLRGFEIFHSNIKSILESGLPTMRSKFADRLLEIFPMQELWGKSIKDKRGGENNIHSWDLELKGPVSDEQKILLNKLFKERRKKKWAEEHGIAWMDGMTLTFEQITTFHPSPNLLELLEDLVRKGYLRYESPKSLVRELTLLGEKTYRIEDRSKPRGYNIVSGKLSFEINKVLSPNEVAPTLVATDMERLAVPDGDGLRRMTLREGMRLFGYPEWFELPVCEKDGFDLLGNTVAVSVVRAISERMAKASAYAFMESEIPEYVA